MEDREEIFGDKLVDMGVDKRLFDDLSDVIEVIGMNGRGCYRLTEKGKQFINEAERHAIEDLPKERIEWIKRTKMIAETLNGMTDEQIDAMLKKAEDDAAKMEDDVNCGRFAAEQTKKISKMVEEEIVKNGK